MNTPPTIVFLVVLMAPGWGVSVVVQELSRSLRKHNIRVVVGCSRREGDFGDLEVHVVGADPLDLTNFLRTVGASAVVAHTSPYFEVLPNIKEKVTRMVWEHGDPTPEFFPTEVDARRGVVEHKRRWVYPSVDSVIASSEFLRADIGWPEAIVVNLAGDHIRVVEPKPPAWFEGRQALRVGTLMRLGSGESHYKGNRLFRELSRNVWEAGIEAHFEVMGRGQHGDAAPFESNSIRVHLNGSDEQRASFLRNLDIFVSPSQWEGFNLPLVEAQQLGTVGLAFDTGAHPEVTPFLLSNSSDALVLIQSYVDNRRLLYEHSLKSYTFVHDRFSWDRSAERFVQVLNAVGSVKLLPSVYEATGHASAANA